MADVIVHRFVVTDERDRDVVHFRRGGEGRRTGREWVRFRVVRFAVQIGQPWDGRRHDAVLVHGCARFGSVHPIRFVRDVRILNCIARKRE